MPYDSSRKPARTTAREPAGTPARKPAELTGRIFRGVDAIRAGLLTKDELRSRAWRKVFRGIYADAELADSYLSRCRAAGRYLIPAPAALAGRTAAWLYGVRLARDTDPVEVLAPPQVRFGPVAGLAIHTADLPDGDVRLIDNIRVTSPLRTGWDLTRWLDLPDAVAYLDVMLSRRLVRADALATYAQERRGRRGWRTFRRAISLTDPAAESPQESRLRVRLVVAGLPKPVSQHVIEGSDGFIARVDLAWPALRVAVEYDGLHHASPHQIHKDRARLNRLVTTDGWIILHVTHRRLREDFAGLVAEIRTALRQQRARRSVRSARSAHA